MKQQLYSLFTYVAHLCMCTRGMQLFVWAGMVIRMYCLISYLMPTSFGVGTYVVNYNAFSSMSSNIHMYHCCRVQYVTIFSTYSFGDQTL